MALPNLSPDEMSGLSNMADYYDDAQRMESGGSADPNTAKNPNSTASGRYQFLDGTQQDVINNHPELAGADKNDPRLMQAFTNDNAAVLRQSLGREPSKVDLYAAHVLGATGATRFLTASPNTPVSQVVSPAAINANPHFFYDKQGNERTVGQVYGLAAQGMKMDPNMPPAAPSGMAGRNPGSYDVASAGRDIPPPPSGLAMPMPAPGQASAASLYPSADALFGPQKAAIDQYIAGQPQVWAKLQQMQDDYKRATTPTFQDKMDDATNGYNQLKSAAQANLHANAGGILLHAEPDATPFVDALKSQHQSDVQARTQRFDQAKTGYDMGSTALLGQETQQGQNLGLTGGLTKDMADYGLQTGKMSLELAKFGQDQAKAIGDYIEKAVPNPETRAQILQQFTSSANPNAPLTTNMRAVDDLIAKAQTNGLQISAKEPAKMYDVITYDPDTGAADHRTVNAATPEGQKILSSLPPGSKVSDLGAPSTNVSVSNTTGEKEGTATSLADQHLTAIQLKQSTDAALALLPWLQAHGGTGVLTDGDFPKEMLNGLRQLTGLDPRAIPARELYSKLMSQIQAQQAGPGMKMMGPRPSQMEFQTLMKGQLGAQSTMDATRVYLDHVGQTADWQRRRIEAQSQAALDAKRSNNTYFDPDNAQIQWQKQPGNQPPVWHTLELTTPSTPAPAASSAPAAAPVPGEVRTLKDGSRWIADPNAPNGWRAAP